MTFHGTVQNGVLRLELPMALPNGTEVRVEVVPTEGTPSGETGSGPTLLERLAPIVGKAHGLPSDAAAQHDHYLYGTPKRT